jgi:TolB-like protein/tetratricopeptide (TPR) repeat protein
MFTDMVGYTALGQKNEALSLALVEEQRKLIRPILKRHNGREVKTIGDAFLVVFPNALDAVRCAYDIQRSARELNMALAETRKIHLRIGVHLGDVVESMGDISGDAVNVASRIEPLAEDGGVCVTAQVQESVHNKFEVLLVRIGLKYLKNVTEPMEVYKMAMPWDKERVESAQELDSKRVAVLPFVSMSPDPNDEFFADGLTEELIDKLCKVGGLEVIARTSVMGYKKKETNITQIGRELNAGTIMEGSVRKVGNRIRVTAQLINANTQGHLWSSSYDRDLDDIFAVQSDIATKVVGSLPGNLSAARAPVPVLKETQDLKAYTLFLQGQALMYEQEEEPLKQSLGFFEQAIERDPTFSRAYAGVARCHCQLGRSGFIPWLESIERGRAAAMKALSVSPELAEAHAILAEISYMTDDFVSTEKEARRALELNPNLAGAYDVLAGIEAEKGNLEGCVSNMETAYQLDPLSPSVIGRLGQRYFEAGREKEAFAHWKRTLHLDPIDSYRGMTDYYISKGDLEKAEAMVKELERIAPTNEFTKLNRGYLAALKGDKVTAMEMVAKLDPTHEPGYATSDFAGFIYLALGDVDKFFEYMSAAAKGGYLRSISLRYSPLFAEVRKDPRMKQILESVGLTLPSKSQAE